MMKRIIEFGFGMWEKGIEKIDIIHTEGLVINIEYKEVEE